MALSNAKAFPSLYKYAGILPSMPRTAAFDPLDEHQLEAILQAIGEIQSAALAVDHQLFFKISLDVWSDIRAVEVIFKDQAARNLQFLRFFACLLPMDSALRIGESGACYDWVLRSVNRDYDPAIRITKSTDFIPLYRDGDPSIGLQASLNLHTWTYTSYTLARTLGGLDALVQFRPELLWDLHLHAFQERQAYGTLLALCAIASYLNKANHEPPQLAEMASFFQEVWQDKKLAPAIRCVAGIMLTTSLARFTAHDHHTWAAIVLAECKSSLQEHETLQLLGVATTTAEQWRENRDVILDEVKAVAQTLRAKALRIGANPEFALGQRNDLIHPLIYVLSRAGLVADIREVLARWHGKEQAGISPSPLFIEPAIGNGLIAVWPTGSLAWTPARGDESFATLVTDANDALGEFVVIQGAGLPNFQNVREGIPVLEKGPRLEKSMLAHFEPHRIKAAVPSDFTPSTLAIFPNLLGPVQAILSTVGLGAPFDCSFTTPQPDRKPRSIKVWAGSTQLTETEIEALRATAALRGWFLDIVVPTGISAEDMRLFKSAYEDHTHDIFWVIGHGEFVPHSSDESGLRLDGGTIIPILEIASWSRPANGRRLLLLNTCSGAAAQLSNGSAQFGLAQQLAGSTQAVIAHLWPIVPATALAFGIALALSFEKDGFFAAFERARALLKDPEALRAFLTTNLGAEHAVLQRTAAASADFANILNWGCPVFIV